MSQAGGEIGHNFSSGRNDAVHEKPVWDAITAEQIHANREAETDLLLLL